ncbi:MAG: cobyrinate a,c-diamide synthase [Thermoprotei archaeon]
MAENYPRPRLIIAATASGVGKTTVSVGLMSALTKRGYTVQPFKIGPDYIDPGYHGAATGRPSRNLDLYMLDEETVLTLFLEASDDADLSVIEGVMGLFDGISGSSQHGSTAHMAKLLGSPVILVVDAWSSASSVAAEVLGFKEFDPEVKLMGVILNRVAGEKHANICAEAIQNRVHVPVLGWLSKSDLISVPERHLGLHAYAEHPETTSKLVSSAAKLIEAGVDLDSVVQLARSAPPIRAHSDFKKIWGKKQNRNVKLAVALDAAFNFYYADSLKLLSNLGAEIIPFSPLTEAKVPEGVCGIYIGGGFPEIYASKLEANSTMRRSLGKLVESEIPFFAECGGLMYLAKAMVLQDGTRKKMVGVLEAEAVMTNRLTIGYVEGRAVRHNIISRRGETYLGHEYHYSYLRDVPEDALMSYKLAKGKGIREGADGWLTHNTLACYTHTHLYSNQKMAARFLDQCALYSRK